MEFGETEPSAWRGGELRAPAPASKVTFNRRELDRILSLYGRKVAAGEWRDYAIDFLKDRAVFSVFRRSSEFPIYRIEKNPRLERRQGAYASFRRPATSCAAAASSIGSWARLTARSVSSPVDCGD